MKGWNNGMYLASSREHQPAAAPSREPGREIMNQEAPPDDGLVVFTCRPWTPEVESWDDFMSAVERAYSRYLDRSRRTITADQTGSDPQPDELDPEG
jgi:hypothetical protein